jgi:hypothetical protein
MAILSEFLIGAMLDCSVSCWLTREQLGSLFYATAPSHADKTA